MSAEFKKRFEAVFLVLHPLGPKMKINAVAKYLKVSEAFVRKYVNRYKKAGNVDNLPNRGKTRKTTGPEDKAIVAVFVKNPTTTLRQAQQILAKKGVNLSLNTIRQRLNESGIKNKSSLIKPLLTEKQRQKRLQWAEANITRDWENVIFTDESTFVVQNSFKRAWSKKGEVFLQRSMKHPLKVHVYGCFSARGFGKLIVFTENLNARKMISLYQKGLLESARMLYDTENENWILQEDNDPKHLSGLCRDWKAENGITRLDWPSQSPDMNPIENVWALMKQKMRGKQIKGLQHLKRTLKNIWKGLSPEYARKLVESCERRCHHILNNNGDWTIY